MRICTAFSTKGEFTHYTLKEITEQPKTVLGAACENVDAAAKAITEANSVYITGSGTSYNASLVAQYMMSRYARVSAIPVVSSEFSYSPVNIKAGSVLIAISQSGESADVISAASDAKKRGARIIAIVNAPESTLARESDVVIDIKCGREIGVAATKSFTSQLVVIYSIVDSMCKGKLGFDVNGVSAAISEILKDGEKMSNLAAKFKDVADIYILGRGIHHPLAMEAALKLKELAYIHAEGIAGGELKHGPLALIDSNVYAIVINPSDATYEDTLTSAREIKARGAHIIGVSDIQSDVYDSWIKIPKSPDHAYPITEIVPIQLLSYYSALSRGTDPDYPRKNQLRSDNIVRWYSASTASRTFSEVAPIFNIHAATAPPAPAPSFANPCEYARNPSIFEAPRPGSATRIATSPACCTAEIKSADSSSYT